MFNAPKIPGEVIERWPIAESGLPARVVNSCRLAGIGTVGELRARDDAQLSALKSVGRSSIADIQSYFELCDAIQAGTLSFFKLQDVFDALLIAEEMEVLRGRYGFMRRDGRIDNKFMTLQEVGNQFRLTRERIRQVERSALLQLRSRLGQAYLHPFYTYLIAFIDHQGGVVSGEEVAQLRNQFWLGEDNPGAVMILLHDIDPSRYTWHRGLFSTLPADQLDEIERQAIEVLRQHSTPIRATQIAETLDVSNPAAAARIMRQSEVILTTRDERCMLEFNGADAFLAELMQASANGSIHYRALATLYNEQVYTNSWRGSGFILRVLNQSTRFQQNGRGQYTLIAP